MYKPNMAKEEIYKPLHSGKYLTESGKQVKELITKLPSYIKVRKLIKMSQAELDEKAQRQELAKQKAEEDRIKKEQDKQSVVNKLKILGLNSDEIEALK